MGSLGQAFAGEPSFGVRRLDAALWGGYRREFPTTEEIRDLNYSEVDDGGRVFILVPRDDGVFRAIQRVEGIPLVSDAQIYLDLIHVGLRGPDQAKALREWKGFCKS